MKSGDVLDTVFKVVMTWAALKAALGTIINPVRGRQPMKNYQGRSIELGDLDRALARRRTARTATIARTRSQRRRRQPRVPFPDYEDIA